MPKSAILLNAIIYFKKYFIIIPIFGTLSHILARLFFMCPYIMKQRQNFVCPSLNQPVYMLTFKQKSLQFWNLVRRYWRGFLRKSQRDFSLKIYLEFLEWFLKIFSWILVQTILFYDFSHFCGGTWGLQLLNLVSRH